MKRSHPDAALLRELLDYDASTGQLTWRLRRPAHFSGVKATREHTCNRWNSTFAGRPALTAPDSGYRSGSLFGRKVLAHRAVWAWYHGRWPECQVDHINGVRDDNRIKNLREVTATVNKRNARLDRRNKSGAAGVCYDTHNRRWVARITHERQRICLGMFERLEDAIAARKEAEAGSSYAEAHGAVDRPYYVHHRDKAVAGLRVQRVEDKLAEEVEFIAGLRSI